jgi:hypothetical protein
MKALLVGMGETGAIGAFVKRSITPEALTRRLREVLDPRRMESMAASGRSWLPARSTA